MKSHSSTSADNKPLKSRSHAIFALAATGFIALLMIFVGYRFIDIVGRHFIFANNTITVHSGSVGESYIFYSQSDNSITLYPWEYYDVNAPHYEDYISNYDESSQDELFRLRDYFDKGYLYDQIRYNFYQTVPEIKPTILRSYGSLYELMDFDGLLSDLSVSYANHQYFYFYQKDLKIDQTVYQLSFALNSHEELLSFQCIPVTGFSPTEADVNLAKNRLAKLINDNYCNSFTLLLYDVLNYAELLENYRLTTSADDNYTFYLNREFMFVEIIEQEAEDAGNSNYSILETYDKDAEYMFNTPLKLEKDTAPVIEHFLADLDYDTETVKKISDGLSQTQIVISGDELLVVLPKLNLVLHFAPDTNTFTGFNHINS